MVACQNPTRITVTVRPNVLQYIESQIPVERRDTAYYQAIGSIHFRPHLLDADSEVVYAFFRALAVNGRSASHYFVDDSIRPEKILRAAREAFLSSVEKLKARCDAQVVHVRSVNESINSAEFTIDEADTADFRELATRRGELHFHRLAEPDRVALVIRVLDARLAGITPSSRIDPNWSAERLEEYDDSARRADEKSYRKLPQAQKLARFTREHPLTAILAKVRPDPKSKNAGRLFALRSDMGVIATVAQRADLLPLYNDLFRVAVGQLLPANPEPIHEVFFVEPRPIFTSETITRAWLRVAEQNNVVLVAEFLPSERQRWRTTTASLVGKTFVLMMDDDVLSSAKVTKPIDASDVELGVSNIRNADPLVVILRQGPLPIGLLISSEN